MALVPFYWKDRPDLFEIERAAMDPAGAVISALDEILPSGSVLDIGAGDGFTAAKLAGDRRQVLALEPVWQMARHLELTWVAGDAAALPFVESSFDAVYATWAYFFPGFHEVGSGLSEAVRVLKPGGLLAIADNLGDDEFCRLSDRDIAVDPAYWAAHGFELCEVETAFEFQSIEEARGLLGFYFGERGAKEAELVLQYRVGVFSVRREDVVV